MGRIKGLGPLEAGVWLMEISGGAEHSTRVSTSRKGSSLPGRLCIIKSVQCAACLGECVSQGSSLPGWVDVRAGEVGGCTRREAACPGGWMYAKGRPRGLATSSAREAVMQDPEFNSGTSTRESRVRHRPKVNRQGRNFTISSAAAQQNSDASLKAAALLMQYFVNANSAAWQQYFENANSF